MSMLAQAARGLKNIWSHGDDDYENDEDDFDTDSETPAHSAPPSSPSKYSDKYSDHKFQAPQSSTSTSNYAPAHGGGSTPPGSRARTLKSVPIPLRAREKNIYTLRPKTQDEAAIAADYLKAGSAVVVNLETIERGVALRIIDFMSGVCYGLEGQGHAMKLGDLIFLFTPGEFEISSDELDYGENREFFFKGVEGDENIPAVSLPQAAPRASQPQSSGPTSSDAYTSSFANSYNTPQRAASQGMPQGGASTPTASSSVAPNASASQAAPRAQTLPTSAVYGSGGKAHVTIASQNPSGQSAPSSTQASSVSRSWER